MSTRTEAIFDVSFCLRDGKIGTIAEPIGGHFMTTEYADAIRLAERLRSEEVNFLMRENAELAREISEINGKIDLLNRTRQALQHTLAEQRGELLRLRGLKFTIANEEPSR